jgi:hypothetical protein
MVGRLGSTLAHGAIGGLVAGGVVAGWFLAIDVALGQPLRTPLLLATLVLGAPSGAAPATLVVGYTILHFGTFVALGMAAAAGLRAIGLAPGLLAGAGVGLGLMTTVHYGGLLVMGADLLTPLASHNVLLANLAAGLAFGAYLHRGLDSDAPLGLAVLRGHATLTQGLITGLLGAGAVALWLLLIDLLAGRPFFTPAALGSALFLGADAPAAVRVTPGIVSAYSVVHLAAFTAVGLTLVWVAERIERAPEFWLMATLAFVLLEGVFVTVATTVATWLDGALVGWTIASANLLAVGAMGGWIWYRRPRLREELLGAPIETRV